MKKFLTFFALACLTVVGAWAQQITDLADITAGKQVYIKRNDGAYYINIANATATTATLQSTPSLITLVDAGDGSFYFYNEDTRLYVGITGTDATTAPSASSTADAGKFTFMTSYGTNTAPNGVFYIHVDNGQRGGGNTDFLNKNNGQPNSIMTWSLSGNSYCQWVVSEATPIEPLFDSTKYYTIKNVKSGNYAVYNTAAVESNVTYLTAAATGNKVWKITPSGYYYKISSAIDETQYIYAISTADANSNVGVAAYQDTDAYLWQIAENGTAYNIIPKGGTNGWNIRGSKAGLSTIGQWSNNGANDNKWVIEEAVPYNVIITGAPTGTKITVKGEEYANGEQISPLVTVSISDIVAPEVTGYTPIISMTGANVVVTYHANIDFTDQYVYSVSSTRATTLTPNQWYFMTQTRDSETPVLDAGLGTDIARDLDNTIADLNVEVNTPASDIANYLVRFVPSGLNSTYQIEFGTGRFLAAQGNAAPANKVQAISSDTYAYNFLITAANGGFDLGATDNGTTRSGFAMDNGNKGQGLFKLNFWSSTVGGSTTTWYLYPVELGEYLNTTTVTYNYYYNGTLKTTKTSTQEIGATVAAPASIHIFTANEYDESAVVSADLVVDVTVKETTPFVAAASFSEIEHWYAMSVRDTKWIYNGGSGSVATNNGAYEASEKYAWGFVGNIFDGYQIYNKEAGSSVALSEDTPCGLTADGTGVTWRIPRVGVLGDASFGLQASGNAINEQNGVLKYWGGFDAGSTFKVAEVYLGEYEYTVNITGAPTGTAVKINGTDYTDGQKVTMDAATATVTPATVSLYNAVVEYVGLNLNINYVACGIKTMSEIVQGQAYTITSGGTRGAFVINNEKLTSTYKAGVTASDADAYQQFLFVQYDSKYYLYSVGADKFISLAEDGKSTVLTDEPVETDIQFLASEHSCKGTNPVVLQMDEHHLGVSNGYNPAVITTWKSTNDEGNSLRIWPVEATIDMDAILAKFTPAPTGVEITIGATGYATMAYNETIVNKPEGLKAYYCINEGEAGHLTPVEWDKDYIPGYCAYILEGTPNTTYTVDCVDTDTFEYPDTDYDAMYDIYMNNVLIGNFDDTDMDVEDAKATYGNHIYVFSKVDDKMGFYTYVGTTLAAHKAFFATEDVSVNGFILDFEGTEGINSVISATNLKAGYDIQGRRINKVQKGINILNGKKVIK